MAAKRSRSVTAKAVAIENRVHDFANHFGGALVEIFHLLGLFAIGAATVWAAAYAFIQMFNRGSATIEDLLLLFIYLEIGAMVGIYFKTNRMPVRFLIYVAITALTRLMIGIVNVEHKADMGILMIAGAILLLCLAVLTIRYGSFRFPAKPTAKDDQALFNSDGGPEA